MFLLAISSHWVHFIIYINKQNVVICHLSGESIDIIYYAINIDLVNFVFAWHFVIIVFVFFNNADDGLLLKRLLTNNKKYTHYSKKFIFTFLLFIHGTNKKLTTFTKSWQRMIIMIQGEDSRSVYSSHLLQLHHMVVLHMAHMTWNFGTACHSLHMLPPTFSTLSSYFTGESISGDSAAPKVKFMNFHFLILSFLG